MAVIALKNTLRLLRSLLAIIFVFPFWLLRKLFLQMQRKGIIKKILAVLASFFVLFCFVPIWLAGYVAVAGAVVYTAETVVGYSPVLEGVSGTGSMYPTFPKGDGKTDKEKAKQVVATAKFIRYPGGFSLGNKKFFNHTLERGDIVVFENNATDEVTQKQYGEKSGYIKRVIALPGDTIELRGGIVYLNGNPLKEPYTAKPRSTFAEDFLSECKQVTLPPGKIFAMGDNRKGSGDSREIGFVDLHDIQSVLTLSAQRGVWDTHWRDTAQDFADSSKIKLDKTKYLELLNQQRKAAGIKPLVYQQKLEESATKRGEVMLKFDDMSWEATRSGYTMLRAMNDAGFWDPAYGEAPSQGYFEADELIENQLEFPSSKKFLLDKDFDQLGIAEVEGTINGCPTQVVILHFAGYYPPNYKQSDIDSWQRANDNLRSIQGSWLDLKNSTEFYQKNKADVDRINEIIAIRIANTAEIAAKMKANQWLTAAEQKLADQDNALADEENAIAKRLNSK